MKISDLSVRELAEQIHKRELKCVDVATEFLNNIEQNSHLNAFIYVNREQVLAEAARLDQEADTGHFRGPLHGVPISIKDNIHVKEMPNSAGTPSLKIFTPITDSTSVELLRHAGCLILGKNNMHELAFGATSDNKAYGRVHNPHDTRYSAGGSSGGSGAAVAAHLVPASLASDTGGSLRIPSSVNGLSGFRPSLNRYSHSGVTPMCHCRDTVGPIAHTVQDLILLDEVLSWGHTFESKVSSLKGLRLGVSTDILCASLDPEVEEAFENAKNILARSGVDIVEVDFHKVKKLHDECAGPLLFNGPGLEMPGYLQKYNIPLTVKEIAAQIASPDVKMLYEKFVLVDHVNLEEHDRLEKEVRPALIEAYKELFDKYEIKALIFPTIPCMPVKFEDIKPETLPLLIRNTSPGSTASMPGLSIPMHHAKSRLPIGLEIDGLENSDQLVLSIGKLIQEVFNKELN